mmetsp:Transcript_20796/g.59338  ORF Transcript_20796/g.59338 Transcript_20796/m.59338 type:complete len:394 (-) Transcript_20796:833-2014(-)
MCARVASERPALLHAASRRLHGVVWCGADDVPHLQMEEVAVKLPKVRPTHIPPRIREARECLDVPRWFPRLGQGIVLVLGPVAHGGLSAGRGDHRGGGDGAVGGRVLASRGRVGHLWGSGGREVFGCVGDGKREWGRWGGLREEGPEGRGRGRGDGRVGLGVLVFFGLGGAQLLDGLLLPIDDGRERQDSRVLLSDACLGSLQFSLNLLQPPPHLHSLSVDQHTHRLAHTHHGRHRTLQLVQQRHRLAVRHTGWGRTSPQTNTHAHIHTLADTHAHAIRRRHQGECLSGPLTLLLLPLYVLLHAVHHRNDVRWLHHHHRGLLWLLLLLGGEARKRHCSCCGGSSGSGGGSVCASLLRLRGSVGVDVVDWRRHGHEGQWRGGAGRWDGGLAAER